MIIGEGGEGLQRCDLETTISSISPLKLAVTTKKRFFFEIPSFGKFSGSFAIIRLERSPEKKRISYVMAQEKHWGKASVTPLDGTQCMPCGCAASFFFICCECRNSDFPRCICSASDFCDLNIDFFNIYGVRRIIIIKNLSGNTN